MIGDAAAVPERSGVLVACFDIWMKIVFNVKVSCAVGMSADQDPVDTKEKYQQ